MINYENIAKTKLFPLIEDIRNYIETHPEMLYDEDKETFIRNIKLFTECATYVYLEMLSRYITEGIVGRAVTGAEEWIHRTFKDAPKLGKAVMLYGGYKLAKGAYHSLKSKKEEEKLREKLEAARRRQKELELMQLEKQLSGQTQIAEPGSESEEEKESILKKIPIVGRFVK